VCVCMYVCVCVCVSHCHIQCIAALLFSHISLSSTPLHLPPPTFSLVSLYDQRQIFSLMTSYVKPLSALIESDDEQKDTIVYCTVSASRALELMESIIQMYRQELTLKHVVVESLATRASHDHKTLPVLLSSLLMEPYIQSSQVDMVMNILGSDAEAAFATMSVSASPHRR
jgi:hypothetical protein